MTMQPDHKAQCTFCGIGNLINKTSNNESYSLCDFCKTEQVNSNMMTTQQIFDKAVGGVIKQGGRSVTVDDDEVRCQYRGPNNLRCAVGHIINYDYYQEGLETANVHTKEVIRAIQYSIGRELLWNENDMLCELQDAHDDSDELLERFKIDSRKIAKRYNLSFALHEGE